MIDFFTLDKKAIEKVIEFLEVCKVDLKEVVCFGDDEAVLKYDYVNSEPYFKVGKDVLIKTDGGVLQELIRCVCCDEFFEKEELTEDLECKECVIEKQREVQAILDIQTDY